MNKKKRHTALGIVLIVIGTILFLLAAAFKLLIINSIMNDDTQAEITEVQEEGENCYVDAVYLINTEPFQHDRDYDSTGFYHVMDKDGYIYIICMHKDDLEKYKYLCTEDAIRDQPVRMEGVALEIDSSLKSRSLKDINSFLEEEYFDADGYDDYIGDYYLFMGADPGLAALNVMTWAVILIGACLLVCGVFCLRRPGRKPEGSASAVQEEQEINPLLGIAGAVIGAALGTIPWLILGMLGYVSAWFGILIIYAAIEGYRRLGHGITRGGKVVSGVIALIMVFVAESMIYIFIESLTTMPGHADIITVTRQFIEKLTGNDDYCGDFLADLFLSYFFVILGLIYFLFQKKNVQRMAKQQAHGFLLKKKYRIPNIIGCAVFLVAILLMAILLIPRYPIIALIAMTALVLVFAVLIFSTQIYLITTVDGFKYRDREHKYRKVIPWKNISRIQEPMQNDTIYQITGKNGSTYLINSIYFEDFEQFLQLLRDQADLEKNYF